VYKSSFEFLVSKINYFVKWRYITFVDTSYCL